jgi:uncharacterized protein (DUF58 family)
VSLGLLGWALGYQALTVVGAGGVLVVAVSFVAVIGPVDLDIARELQPSRVERGQPALGVVTVSNPGRRRVPACMAEEPVGERVVRVRIPALDPGTRTRVPYRLPTNRRGTVAIGPLQLVRADPLGLWENARNTGEVGNLWVRPRVETVEARPGGRTRHLEGPTVDSAPQGSITFHTLREYVAGDDLRRVHWRTSARTGTLMVRQNVDTSLPSTVVVIDCRADRYDGDDFEEAVDVAAAVVAASSSRGFPVRVVTTTGRKLSTSGGQSAAHLMDFLADLQADAESGTDLTKVGGDALGGRDHDALVVVAGRVDARDVAATASLGRSFGVVVLATVDGSTGRTTFFPGGVRLDGTDAGQILGQWRAGGREAGSR